MGQLSRFTRVFFLLAFFGASAQGGQIPLWGNDSSNNLYVVDFDSLEATFVSSTDVTFFDIAFDSEGDLFGVSGGGELYQIDAPTGATSLVGELGTNTNSLVFGFDGTLWSAGVDTLYEVDRDTGIAEFAVDLWPFDSAGDLAYDSDGNLLLATLQGMLLRIDTEAGTFDVLGELGFPNVLGLTSADDGRVFGFTSGNQLLGVDPDAGVAENLGTITALDFVPGQTYGSSFSSEAVPEPGTMVLMGGGGVWIASRKRRRR